MTRTTMHPFKILAAVGAAFVMCGLLFAYASSPAWAAIITVNSLADDADGTDGECTLREAIIAANTDTASGMATGECAAGSATENDIIQFALPGTAPWTVNLTGALPNLSTNIEIEGPGADQFTVRRDMGGDYSIFTVTSGSVVSISGITISNGNTTLPGGGAGGGINNFRGTLTITGSTISGNSASHEGGGIANIQGTLTVTGSTISDNSAFEGGGIYSDTNLSGTQTTTITNSTISGNTARLADEGDGGGVRNFEGLTVIEFSTITDNTALNDQGSGVASFGDTLTRTEVLSTIISANTNTDVDSGTTTNSFDSKGYNLIGDGNATGAFNQTGDQLSTDPKLGALAENGGPTQTHALLTDSPAIDAGPPTDGATIVCPPPSTDQRGVERPQDGNADSTQRCDKGSFELDPTPNTAPTVAVAAGGTCTSGNSGTINLRVADAESASRDLTLTATSSNPALVPQDMISFSGTGAKRTMTATTSTGSGTSTLTVEVSDGSDSSSIPIHFTVGTSASETLTGSAEADMILARSGNDTATGKGAKDLLCGGNGNDTLSGGGGLDTMLGGGNDDTLTGGGGADFFGGGSGTDTATDFDAGQGDTQSAIP